MYQQVRSALPPAAADGVAVRVDPFAGRIAADDAFLLERQVWVGSQRYQQAVVIDPTSLVADLERSVMQGSELAPFARLYWGLPNRPDPPEPSTPFSFSYRFADPFADMAVRVDLLPIPAQEPAGMQWLVGLGACLAVVVCVGLVAVHRMVATRLAYARRRSDFVAAVTHELKTPLTAIRMYGDMLGSDMGDDPKARQRYAGILDAEGERLSRLIDNVLELSRLEHDDRPVHMTVGQPQDLLQGVVQICQPHAQQHGFSLELACDDGLPGCRCDRDALIQVVVNLVDNAIKFTPEEAPKRVILGAHMKQDRLVISVRDFGPGVPAGMLTKICEPFVRGERELTRRTKGTGIGLALVAGLVRRMGGELHLDNHPEGGFLAQICLAPAA